MYEVIQLTSKNTTDLRCNVDRKKIQTDGTNVCSVKVGLTYWGLTPSQEKPARALRPPSCVCCRRDAVLGATS